MLNLVHRAVTAVHSISALVLGVTLIVSQSAQAACAGRTFCWSPRVFQSMESQLGYVLFECVFSAFKAKHFVLPLGAAEDILFMLVLLFQRVRCNHQHTHLSPVSTQVYPCAAVTTVFPWWCVMRGASLFWAADHLLRATRTRAWHWLFINEMLRTTATAAKLLLSAVLAWQVSQARIVLPGNGCHMMHHSGCGTKTCQGCRSRTAWTRGAGRTCMWSLPRCAFWFLWP